MTRSSRKNPVDARIGRIGRYRAAHHDADTDRAIGARPVGDRFDHARIVRIDRLDQPEPAGMCRVHFQSVARIVAIHGERRHQQSPIDTDGVHGSHHLVAGHVRWTAQHRGPWTARMVVVVGVYLTIDCRHDVLSPH